MFSGCVMWCDDSIEISMRVMALLRMLKPSNSKSESEYEKGKARIRRWTWIFLAFQYPFCFVKFKTDITKPIFML